tara:strand:+ start:1237 stop:2157 length:921 start_codon:yes stop_codon:yes gene_type:complete
MSNETNKINPLKLYIETLIEKIDDNYIVNDINLILDGGAFNGGYQLGILLYLKELENKKIININKISGCSVGAIMGAMYISNSLSEGIDYYGTLLKYYQWNSDLSQLSRLINDFVNKNINDVTIFNDKLYITYYDLINIKQTVVSKYASKNDLIDALIKSSYIPGVVDGNINYHGCCDGFLPYIFPKKDKQILYIYLQPFYKIKNMLYVKNENNVWPRLLIGMTDINNFFLGKHSEFCSYVNKWSLSDTYIFRIKELIVLFIVLILNYIEKFIENIPERIKHNEYVLRIKTILKFLYKDIFRHILL